VRDVAAKPTPKAGLEASQVAGALTNITLALAGRVPADASSRRRQRSAGSRQAQRWPGSRSALRVSDPLRKHAAWAH